MFFFLLFFFFFFKCKRIRTGFFLAERNDFKERATNERQMLSLSQRVGTYVSMYVCTYVRTYNTYKRVSTAKSVWIASNRCNTRFPFSLLSLSSSFVHSFFRSFFSLPSRLSSFELGGFTLRVKPSSIHYRYRFFFFFLKNVDSTFVHDALTSQ